MKKLVREKLYNRSGYSLIELLACIIVLVLVTGIITLVVNISVKYYTESMRQSAADMLSSSLSSAVQEELEFASKVTTTDSSDAFSGFYYYSRARGHGAGCCIETNDNGQVVITKGGKQYPLLGSKSYAHGIIAEINTTYNPVQKLFHVVINIHENSNPASRVLSSADFYVTPINKGN